MIKKKPKFGLAIVFIFLISVGLFYLVIGEKSYIAIQDNLDLFMAQFAMLKNTGTFFTQNAAAPFLGGVTRDGLPSELSLYSVFFMILPEFPAYVLGYLAKVIIAVFSCRLLFLDMLPASDSGKDVHAVNLATLVGLLYGVLNLFPAFGIPFAAIPLVVYLLRRAYFSAVPGTGPVEVIRKSCKWQLLILLYPFLSYFSYIGIFIIGYLFVAIIWLWIRDKKPSVSLMISFICLCAGSMIFEYRLFSMMLFSDTVSIRDSMVQTYLGAGEILSETVDVFINGMMHVEDVHKLVVMPLCLAYLVFLNVRYIVKKNAAGIFRDVYNLCFVILIFNCIVYGLYYSEAVQKLVETVLPPLKGWQYNRTIFFNPFIWCAMLFIIVVRLSKKGKAAFVISYVIVFVCGAVVLLSPTRYNDLYNTAYHTARSVVFHNENDDLNYGEFYSTELFENIKSDIGYRDGEWAVAYGMHPAVLEYNGIYTLDGYLGFYSQEYKDAFRKVIAPALERKEATRLYFDEWGARCYLYSGTDDSIVMATKSMFGVTDTDIYINSDALRYLGCKYIFSRIDISNAEEVGIKPVKTYAGFGSPYVIHVYSLDQ